MPVPLVVPKHTWINDERTWALLSKSSLLYGLASFLVNLPDIVVRGKSKKHDRGMPIHHSLVLEQMPLGEGPEGGSPLVRSQLDNLLWNTGRKGRRKKGWRELPRRVDSCFLISTWWSNVELESWIASFPFAIAAKRLECFLCAFRRYLSFLIQPPANG